MLDDWLPYHPKSRVALTYVEPISTSLVLVCVEMTGTARPNDRRAFAEGEGIWWVRGHVDEDSPEGLALLAAYALDRGQAA